MEIVTDLGGSLLGPSDPVAVVVGLTLALVCALGPGELLGLPLVLPLGPEMQTFVKYNDLELTLRYYL